MPTLEEIFLHELKDLYSAESQLIAALPKMSKASNTPELAQAFDTHLAQTREQKNRLEQVAKLLDESLAGETCKAMKGLVEEGQGIIEEFDESAARDAALIAAAQRVEHYEIAAYGSAVALAKALGHEDVASLLDATLQEEGDTDKLLTQICEGTVIPNAMAQGDDLESAPSKSKSSSAKARKSNGASGKGANGTVKASKSASGSDDLESMTRDELYKLAQEREIEGRSGMDKDALVKALR